MTRLIKRTVSLILALALAFTISVMAAQAKSPEAREGGLAQPAIMTDTGVPIPDTGANGFANVAVACGAAVLAVAGAAALKR